MPISSSVLIRYLFRYGSLGSFLIAGRQKESSQVRADW